MPAARLDEKNRLAIQTVHSETAFRINSNLSVLVLVR